MAFNGPGYVDKAKEFASSNMARVKDIATKKAEEYRAKVEDGITTIKEHFVKKDSSGKDVDLMDLTPINSKMDNIIDRLDLITTYTATIVSTKVDQDTIEKINKGMITKIPDNKNKKQGFFKKIASGTKGVFRTVVKTTGGILGAGVGLAKGIGKGGIGLAKGGLGLLGGLLGVGGMAAGGAASVAGGTARKIMGGVFGIGKKLFNKLRNRGKDAKDKAFASDTLKALKLLQKQCKGKTLSERVKLTESYMKAGFVSNKAGQFIIGKWKEADKLGIDLDLASKNMMSNLREGIKATSKDKEKHTGIFGKFFNLAKGAGGVGLGLVGGSLALAGKGIRGIGRFAANRVKGATQGFKNGKGLFGKLGGAVKGVFTGPKEDEENPNSAKRREGSFKDFELDKKEAARDKVQQDMRDETIIIRKTVEKILIKMGGTVEKKPQTLLDKLLNPNGDGEPGGEGSPIASLLGLGASLIGGKVAGKVAGKFGGKIFGKVLGKTAVKGAEKGAAKIGLKSLGKVGLKGLMKAGGKAALKGALAATGLGIIPDLLMGIPDVIDAVKNSESVTGAAPGTATLGQKIGAGAAGMASSLTMGLVSSQSIYGGAKSLTRKVGSIFGKKDYEFPVMTNSDNLSSPFGMRDSPIIPGTQSFHGGIDTATPSGTPIKAFDDGTVFKLEMDNPVFGGVVVLKHKDNMYTVYGHMSSIAVKMGQKVSIGETIGLSGGELGEVGAGESTGAHLHFSIIKDGKLVDPITFVQGKGVTGYETAPITPTYTGLLGLKGGNADALKDIVKATQDPKKMTASSNTPLDKTATSPEDIQEIQAKNQGEGMFITPSTSGYKSGVKTTATLKESPIITTAKSATKGTGGSEEITIAIELYKKMYYEQVRHDSIAEEFYKFMQTVMSGMSSRDETRFKQEAEFNKKMERQARSNVAMSGMPLTGMNKGPASNYQNSASQYHLSEYDSIAEGY
jgi:hypothetical protein